MGVFLGTTLSAQTVSRIVGQLDAAVAAFHRRGLSDRYRYLLLDGVVVERILAEAELDDDLFLTFAREAKVKQPLMQAARKAGWSGG
ncbi:MAG: transposase [Nitrospirae bacterium]|nr:transposase [Nitrospirota bacterium]